MSAPYWVRSSKTDKEEAEAQGQQYWGGGSRSHESLGKDARYFVESRDRATTLAESSDPNACYSYDDYALCELDGTFYVFNTSGCSCPSPSETWSITKMGTRAQIAAELNSWKDDKYSSASSEFKREVNKVWPEVTAPGQGAAGVDW